MGIRGLNNFLRANCQRNLRRLSLSKLQGKTIVVDASIYMYRFQGDGGLIEGMYQMVGLLYHNNITPIFVFDGKPPPEKKELLEKRKQDKNIAEKRFNEIKKQISTSYDEDVIAELETEADQLRYQFVRITNRDVVDVKNLLQIMGISYYESDGESDGICAKMVQQKIAYACLSEDMDMFIYGCPRVLRYLSLLKSSVVLYDLRGIMNTLCLKFDDFKNICLLAGTDYNVLSSDSLDLNRAVKLYAKYSKNRNGESYMKWLVNNNHIKDVETFIKIKNIFDTQDIVIEKDRITVSVYDKEALKSLLSKYGFIFPK